MRNAFFLHFIVWICSFVYARRFHVLFFLSLHIHSAVAQCLFNIFIALSFLLPLLLLLLLTLFCCQFIDNRTNEPMHFYFGNRLSLIAPKLFYQRFRCAPLEQSKNTNRRNYMARKRSIVNGMGKKTEIEKEKEREKWKKEKQLFNADNEWQRCVI